MIKIFALREMTVQWEGKCISKRLQLRVMSIIDGENPECGGRVKRILSSTLIASDIYRDGKNMRSISSVGGWSRKREEHSPGTKGLLSQRREMMLPGHTQQEGSKGHSNHRSIKIPLVHTPVGNISRTLQLSCRPFPQSECCIPTPMPTPRGNRYSNLHHHRLVLPILKFHMSGITEQAL